MFVAEQACTRTGVDTGTGRMIVGRGLRGRRRLIAGFQLRVTKETLILVEVVLFAVKALLILYFRVAEPTAIFIPTMLFAPESAWITFGRIADETRFGRIRMAVC